MKRITIPIASLITLLLSGCAVECPLCNPDNSQSHLFHTVIVIDANTGKVTAEKFRWLPDNDHCRDWLK